MFVKAQLKAARVTPRKARLVRQLVIGLPANEALAQLSFHPSKAAAIIRKILLSALANASHNYDLPADDLRVKDLVINDSFKFKRWQPASRGISHPYSKRNSRISVVLAAATPTTTKKSRPAQADIKTLTVEEKIAQDSTAQVSTQTTSSQDQKKVSTPTKPSKDQAVKVHPKIKMRQAGSGAKKTFRRKSI